MPTAQIPGHHCEALLLTIVRTTGRRLPWTDIRDGWTTPYKTEMPIPVQIDGENFNLEHVKAGSLLLSATINKVVLNSYCSPPLL